MAVHVPLSAEAQAEARLLMLSANNLLKPQDGKPVTIPSQDMVLGSYYLTIDRDTEPGAGKVFRDPDEALMAYNEGIVGIHAPIKVRMTREIGGKKITKIVDATPGRLIFNERIPQDLGFVDRSDPDKLLDLEIMFTCGKEGTRQDHRQVHPRARLQHHRGSARRYQVHGLQVLHQGRADRCGRGHARAGRARMP